MNEIKNKARVYPDYGSYCCYYSFSLSVIDFAQSQYASRNMKNSPMTIRTPMSLMIVCALINVSLYGLVTHEYARASKFTNSNSTSCVVGSDYPIKMITALNILLILKPTA